MEEENPELKTLDLHRTVGVNNAPPDALEAQQLLSPTINSLTHHLEQLHMDLCLGTVGYGQPRLTKARTTQASQSSADLWPVVVGYGWSE
ncbi:hypothetical protein PAXRUDRAFT_832600, partial [Paxillus rubicundulus Ve08.2h10]